MGIIFVAAVGFGALPGVLALGLHSVGMVGKFFAESIEHVAEEPIEAVEAVGATRLHLYHWRDGKNAARKTWDIRR
jgi:phosphonate transport system permease protein